MATTERQLLRRVGGNVATFGSEAGSLAIETPAFDTVAALQSMAESTLQEPVGHDDVMDFPCSIAQERFWLLDRLEPGNPSYSVAVRWRLEGRLRTDLLQQAWQHIIQRHEVMRTMFPLVDGQPVQRVLPRIPFKLTEIDLSDLPEAERDPECDRIGGIEARAPFDLATGPLIRVTLVRLSSETAVVLVTTHQVVSDGWSIGVMAREMGEVYAALAAGRKPDLPELTIQYGDYAQWQLEWLGRRGTEAETSYWTQQLAGVRPFQVWPDRPRPTAPTTHGAIASLVLPRELTNSAQAMSAEHGATLFAAALAGLCATLNRFTGEPEIVIGTQVSGRDQVELEPMIGQFVNSLILRNRLTDDPTFAQLVERLRDTVADALEYRHISIERLLGMLKAEHYSQGTAPISINFIFQKTFIQRATYGELTLIDMPSLPAGAIYDLNFFMVERPDGWRFSCQYNTDQFERETAERLLSYFQSALESGTASPSSRVSELRLSAEEEEQRCLAKLNDSRAAYPGDRSLSQLFDEIAAVAPDTVAVQCGNTKLSYRQLEAAANRVAEELLDHGIAVGNTVALSFGRSVEYVVGVLGVLKAGAAWAALNTASLPQVRSVLQAIDAKAVLADAPHGAALAGVGLPILEVNATHGDHRHMSRAVGTAGASSSPAADIDSPAYITPLPAGDSVARISHRSLVNLIFSMRRRPGISERDALLSVEPWTRDATSVDILLALTSGARLVIATAEEQADGHRLSRAVQRSNATVLQAAPQTLEKLASCEWHGNSRLKVLCGGGDPQRSLLEYLHRRSELWLLRGWAQAAIWSCALPVREFGMERLRQLSGTPTGFPVANTRFQVIDRKGKPALVGTTGELCVEGDGLPAGKKLLHTGEAARIRRDGIIERAVQADEQPPEDTSGVRPGTGTDTGSANTGIEQCVAAIWCSIFERSVIDSDANFFELGGHSLLAARMLARVEAELGRRISLATLFRAPTIQGLSRALATESRHYDFRQVVKLQANGSRTPLIAINNTGVYYLLAKRLGAEQPVVSLQLFDPSIKDQAVPDSLEKLAAEYVKLIHRVRPSGPYLLMGWCVAGALTFEIARQLAAANQEIRGLFLMDSWVPRYFKRQTAWRRVVGERSLRWQFLRVDWTRLMRGEDSFERFLNKRTTLQSMLKRFRRKDARTGEAAAPSSPENYDQWLLAFLEELTTRYEPQRYPGKITLFRSLQEPTGWLFDPLAGWGRFADRVDLHLVAGDHFSMFQEPGATQMAQHMSSLLGTMHESAR